MLKRCCIIVGAWFNVNCIFQLVLMLIPVGRTNARPVLERKLFRVDQFW
jgi:hypothetical protein